MKTIPRPHRFLLHSCDDQQVLTAFSLRSPRFSRTWLDVVRAWPSVKGFKLDFLLPPVFLSQYEAEIPAFEFQLLLLFVLLYTSFPSFCCWCFWPQLVVCVVPTPWIPIPAFQIIAHKCSMHNTLSSAEFLVTITKWSFVVLYCSVIITNKKGCIIKKKKSTC
jgi:hypothetical protein